SLGSPAVAEPAVIAE
nr:RecName: Full=Platelet-derived growth factor subunit B; Short=PDGF subunit B; AltName: Full=PDGF-2; AltName: Full=Platelet-derived growth factor B chain; AltName: Full=Platelet-derived growth factor beta polypeptide [Sus scrofa]